MTYCANCGRKASTTTQNGYMPPMMVSTPCTGGRVPVCSPECGANLVRMSEQPDPPMEGCCADLLGFEGDTPPMGDGLLADLQFEG